MLTRHLGAMAFTLLGHAKKEMNTERERERIREGWGRKREGKLYDYLESEPSLRPHSLQLAWDILQSCSGWTGYLFTCLFWFGFWFPSVGNKQLGIKSEATNIPTITSLHSGSKKQALFCWCSKDVLKQNVSVLPAVKEWADDQQILLPS